MNLLAERWYAVVNDLIGGWCIATADKPLSQHRPDDGVTFVGDFLSEEIARHVVELHNASLPAPPTRRAPLDPRAVKPLPEDLAALPADDPFVVALAARINARSHLIHRQTIGGVVAALRELRSDGTYDANDVTLLDAAATRIGYPGPGTIRLSIVRHVIGAMNAETAEVPGG